MNFTREQSQALEFRVRGRVQGDWLSPDGPEDRANSGLPAKFSMTAKVLIRVCGDREN
ncbi:MAG: hypothetical protein U1E25_03295 [Methylocystis sp.]